MPAQRIPRQNVIYCTLLVLFISQEVKKWTDSRLQLLRCKWWNTQLQICVGVTRYGTIFVCRFVSLENAITDQFTPSHLPLLNLSFAKCSWVEMMHGDGLCLWTLSKHGCIVCHMLHRAQVAFTLEIIHPLCSYLIWAFTPSPLSFKPSLLFGVFLVMTSQSLRMCRCCLNMAGFLLVHNKLHLRFLQMNNWNKGNISTILYEYSKFSCPENPYQPFYEVQHIIMPPLKWRSNTQSCLMAPSF